MCIEEKQNISSQSFSRNLSHLYTSFQYLWSFGFLSPSLTMSEGNWGPNHHPHTLANILSPNKSKIGINSSYRWGKFSVQTSVSSTYTIEPLSVIVNIPYIVQTEFLVLTALDNSDILRLLIKWKKSIV